MGPAHFVRCFESAHPPSVCEGNKWRTEWASGAGSGIRAAEEVAPLGIRVTIVEPGPFRTDFAGRSMRFADAIDDYRDTPAGRLRERFSDQNGVQPGDPARAAAASIRAVCDENAPLRLPLGPDAVRRIREKLQGQLVDLNTWESVAVATGYPAT